MIGYHNHRQENLKKKDQSKFLNSLKKYNNLMEELNRLGTAQMMLVNRKLDLKESLNRYKRQQFWGLVSPKSAGQAGRLKTQGRVDLQS